MTDKQRYKQLIKENNDVLNVLSDSYRRIGYNYVKKARGYGIKSLDTEVKIKKVLEELTEYDTLNHEANIVIPNMTNYIESHIKELSKAPTLKFRIQEIVAVTIFLLCIVGYFVINIILNRPSPLATPTNITSTYAEETFILSWDGNLYAEEGYYVVVYIDDVKQMEKSIKLSVDSVTQKQYARIPEVKIEQGKTYKFEIYAKETKEFKQSEKAIYILPNS